MRTKALTTETEGQKRNRPEKSPTYPAAVKPEES